MPGKCRAMSQAAGDKEQSGEKGNYILNSNAYYSYMMSKETGTQVEHLNVKTK